MPGRLFENVIPSQNDDRNFCLQIVARVCLALWAIYLSVFAFHRNEKCYKTHKSGFSDLFAFIASGFNCTVLPLPVKKYTAQITFLLPLNLKE